MKTDHLGDLFHSLGFCCGCSELKCYLGNSGLVFIANSKIISSIHNSAAQTVCKQTHTECETPTVIYTTERGGGKNRKSGRERERERERETKNYMQKLGYLFTP